MIEFLCAIAGIYIIIKFVIPFLEVVFVFAFYSILYLVGRLFFDKGEEV